MKIATKRQPLTARRRVVRLLRTGVKARLRLSGLSHFLIDDRVINVQSVGGGRLFSLTWWWVARGEVPAPGEPVGTTYQA